MGCEAAYHFLTQCNLGDFYALRTTITGPALDIQTPSQFSELDDPGILDRFRRTNGEVVVQFYVEGVHCVACLWVLEKLGTLVPEIHSSRLNMGTSVLTLTADAHVQLSKIAITISKMGYRPRLLTQKNDARRLKTKENRRELLRVGIAFAINGNIMLMTVPLYGGASGHWEHLFSVLSAATCGIVVTFCALPFYRSALGALRRKSINIDTPIAIAIIGGFVMSLYEMSRGSPTIYFDTIAMFTALLLGSRYLLRVIQQKTSDATHSIWNGLPSTVTKVSSNGARVSVHAERVQIGDTVEVAAGSIIPIDGPIISGESHVNMAIITGESFPQKVKPGTHVTAGTYNIDTPLLIQTQSTGTDTRVGKLLAQLSELPPLKSFNRRTALPDASSLPFLDLVPDYGSGE